jgi:hypothetical protein
MIDISGTCSVTAAKAADTNYNAATSSAAAVTMIKANQATLTVSVTPSALIYGNTAALSSSGGSGTGVETYSAGASTGCSVAGSTLSVTNASGSCSVTAAKAADTNYNVATSSAAAVTMIKANQAILAIVAPAILADGNTATLSTTGGSGTGAVTFSAGASTGCSVAGSILSVTNASGTCSVTAARAADTNYNVATSSGSAVTLVVADGKLVTIPTGTVSASDALKALRIAAGLDVQTANDLAHGDVAPLANGQRQPDGKISSADVVAILRKVALLPSW